MTFLNIDTKTVKSSFPAFYEDLMGKCVEWKGRAVVYFDALGAKFLPYLQNQKIAVPALIAVTLVIHKIGNILGRKCSNLFSNNTSLKDFCHLSIELSTVFFGVKNFTSYTNLPLTKPVIIGITVLTTLISFLTELQTNP